MAGRRESSEFVKALGALIEFWQAIVFAVFNLGGNDSDLRRVFKAPGLADKIAALIMGESRLVQEKPQSDIAGLEVFEAEVDGDNTARWGKIEPKKYAYCNSNARTGDFPVKPGKRVVRYVLLSFDHESTNQQVIDETERRNLSRPDRAITETILDLRKAECADHPIVGVCGVVRSYVGGGSVVGDVHEGDRGRSLRLRDLRHGWSQYCRFVAVISE